MRWSSFQRARRYGRRPDGWLRLQLAAFVSAMTTALLIVVLGLITDLLVTKGHPSSNPSQYKEWAKEYDVPLDSQGLFSTVVRLREWPLLGSALRKAYVWNSWLRSNLSCLVLLLTMGLALALVQAASQFLVARLGHRCGLDVVTRLREAIVTQAFSATGTEMLSGRTSRPKELFERQSEQLRSSLTAVWQTSTQSLLRVIFLVLLALLTGIWLTTTALVFATLTLLLVQGLRRRSIIQRRLWEDRASQYHARLLERLRLVPLVNGYNLTRPPGQDTSEELRRHREASFKALAADAGILPAKILLMLLGASLVLLLVGVNILKDDMSVAGTVVLGTALFSAYFPITGLFRLRGSLDSADRAAAEIFALLDREPTVGQAPAAVELPPISKHVKLDQVHLADRFGRKLLDDISVTIPAGSFIAIVGSDPDMAPALAGLLLRMFDPAAGQILYDDLDARQSTLASLRERVVYVAGDGMLFSADISTNISCGDASFTQLDVIDSAKRAHAYSFIQQLPHGFATIVDPSSDRINPGQAFRIGLARALLRNPSVLIVQEPEGELSEGSAEYIDEAIHRARTGRTIIMLPSRPATLRKVESIALFRDGKLHAAGSHAELIKSNELYRHLLYVRFNDFKETSA